MINDEGTDNDKNADITNAITNTSSTDTTVKTVKSKLPATMMASVLDFMEYGDFRAILCTGKYVAVNTVKHVKTINITRECQLFTGPKTKSVTRRFANVNQVNCLCLVQEDGDGGQRLSIKAATRLVPFLMAFPKLSSAFVGGAGHGGPFEYDAERCVSPHHHGEAFQALAKHIWGSIRSGGLSYRLNLQGVPGFVYDDSTAQLPVLPADTWGSVLDFITYCDIQTAAQSSKVMFEEAIEHVQTLTITNPSELSTSRNTNPLIHRFRGVKEVNCFCFFESNENGFCNPCDRTFAQIVPFLTTFPKLSAAFLGRRDYGWRREYTFQKYRAGRGDQAAIRGLVEQFCGAFESGALPPNLDLKGVLACHDDDDAVDGLGLEKVYCTGGGSCRACSRICSSFPFNIVVRLVEHGSTCIPDAVRISALRDRPGSTEYFRSEAAIDGLLRMLSGYMSAITIQKHSRTLADQIFLKRMAEIGYVDSREDVTVRYLFGQARESLRSAIVSGFKETLTWASGTTLIASVHAYFFSREVRRDDCGSIRMKEFWVRSSLNFLIELGFDLDPNDFFLVDPYDEPALLQRMQRMEEE